MTTDLRHCAHPDQVKHFTTDDLISNYKITGLFTPDQISSTYTMHDRMIVMGVNPVKSTLQLPTMEEWTKADYFLERRELGIINVGGSGKVIADGENYTLENKECLYLGKGVKEVLFESSDAANPAEFYLNSLPAHANYPNAKATLSDANQVSLGTKENCNERVIYQYIHEDGINSCQLVMGFTELKTGSIWNTFPPHTHYRRMEVYMYFDLPEDQMVMHFMGDPSETRHLVMRDKDAVISPEWSIHSGAGTSAYKFIWSMGGENKAFTDMDGVPMNELR